MKPITNKKRMKLNFRKCLTTFKINDFFKYFSLQEKHLLRAKFLKYENVLHKNSKDIIPQEKMIFFGILYIFTFLYHSEPLQISENC